MSATRGEGKPEITQNLEDSKAHEGNTDKLDRLEIQALTQEVRTYTLKPMTQVTNTGEKTDNITIKFKTITQKPGQAMHKMASFNSNTKGLYAKHSQNVCIKRFVKRGAESWLKGEQELKQNAGTIQTSVCLPAPHLSL